MKLGQSLSPLAASLTILLGTAVCAQVEQRRLFVPPEEEQEQPFVQELAFSPLPPDRAPDHSHWSNSIAICTSIKDENLQDMVEWVEYHKYVRFAVPMRCADACACPCSREHDIVID